ncbi:MAG: S8 family serine peptidase [Pirellulales bacterium]|nr:S8 family serine peptidase [Pirellulales bacterium]
MPKEHHPQFRWSGKMETLEDRLVMSADPLGGLLGCSVQHHALADAPLALDHHQESTPDFWIDTSYQNSLEEHLRQIDQSLASAHDQTGLTQVRSDYGFSGIGQTVAVIDSGIAYDHAALGGGFGKNYRVVGGWDFTGENDANPYDDGPEGSHGTHVSGIIGSNDSTHTGVAPGVDLVGLRVFDDVGAGYFSWVENALDWVHTNRNSFENPITAVNLSLGVANWNSDTIPNWANLEDEFAQLEADGIFISVAAGNSYTSHTEAGLSYPAASSHVIPVMSTDDSGLLSYFSQRHSRAIAAPGRWITSTVPDYAGNNNGTDDDFARFSGTSMAAPYVAGSSVLIREAMEFAGHTNITQDTIYDQMAATADSFYDTATNTWYDRLNLEAAIYALMPIDDYGSSLDSAYSLGMVNDPISMSGAITTLGDIDYFAFTAENSGTVTFTASNMTHAIDTSWQVSGGTGTWSGDDNEIFTVNVTAGQNYTVGLSSADGLGYYDLDITSESTFSFTDWGSVAFNELDDVSIAGETWYRFEAASAGYLTAEAMFDNTSGQVSLELYDYSLQLIDTGNSVGSASRVDVYASAGDEVFLKVSGTNNDVDFRLTNLVSLSGTTVQVAGTAGDDVFSFAAGNTYQVVVNGVSYSFAAISVTNVNFAGSTGNDSITLTGTSGNETAVLSVGQATLNGNGFAVLAHDMETVDVYGNGGNDTATLYDSAGDDILVARMSDVAFSGTGFTHTAYDFSETYAYSTGGTDHAELHDSAGNDDYRAYYNRAIMKGTGFYNYARDFASTHAYSTQGTDAARLYDSSGDDTYTGYSDHVTLAGSGFSNRANDFALTYTYATSGHDVATFYDTAEYDLLRAYHNKMMLSGSGYFNYVRMFDENYAYSTGGNDFANFYDSVGNDEFLAHHDRATMTGSGYFNSADGFARTQAHSFGGQDIARFYDSIGSDTFKGYSRYALMVGTGFNNTAKYFAQTYAYSTAGDDTAAFYDSAGDDLYEGYYDHATFSGIGFSHAASQFSSTYAYSTQGYDIAKFYDSVGDDDFRAYHNRAILQGTGFYNRANNFSANYGYSSQGNDEARFYDSPGNDVYESYFNYVTLSGTGFHNYASGFCATYAYASTGYDTATFHDSSGDDTYRAFHNRAIMSGVGFLNYARLFDQTHTTSSQGNDVAKLFDSTGDDSLQATGSDVTLSGTNFNNRVNDFANVQAFAINGGNNNAHVQATDLVFQKIGDWI